MSSNRAEDKPGLRNRPPWEADHASLLAQGLPNGAKGRANDKVEGLVNGLVNGRGRTNGLVNSSGRTNGLVNGLGYTNGLRLRGNTHAAVVSADLRRAAIFIAGSMILVIVLGVIMGAPGAPPSPFDIDGDFSEWSSVAAYSDEVDPIVADADLIAFKVHAEPGQLFLYGEARGTLFPSADPASLYVLIDDPSRTGYDALGLDVDYIAEAWGWQNALRESLVREWSGATDRDNASAFQRRGSFAGAVVGTQFELVLPEYMIDFDPARGIRLSIVTKSGDVSDAGAVFGASPGALVVDQRPLTTLVSTVSPVLELRVRAQVADVEVRAISHDYIGSGVVGLPALPFTVAAGQERIEQISFDPSGLANFSFATFRITGINAMSTSGTPVPTTLRGDSARFYVQAAPALRMIDGLFADWSNGIADVDDPLLPDSIDIRESAVALGSDAFFYVRTDGAILAGTVLPERRFRPLPPANGSTPGPTLPLPRRTAENVLRIYVDTDDRDSVGEPIGGIQADRMLEVRGRMGRITSRMLNTWDGAAGAWQPLLGSVNVAFAGPQIETSASLAFLGPTFNPRVVFATTDWSSRGDLSDIPSLLATSTGPSIGPLHGFPSQSVTPPVIPNIPVIDGECGGIEYLGAATRNGTGLGFRIGIRMDTQNVYICVDARSDVTDNIGFDWGGVLFDTKHNGGPGPQEDDRLFYIYAGDPFGFALQGDGIGWVPCVLCDPSNMAANFFVTHQVYEFAIAFLDVWGTTAPTPNQVAGFAVYVWDAGFGTDYFWGSSLVDPFIPNSWGHIVFIPEFPTIVLAVPALLAIPLILRRRSRDP